MAKNNNLPLVIGHLKNGESDKCILAAKKDGCARIAICKLKYERDKVSGDNVQIEDIEGIIKEIWICRKESLKVFIDSLQSIYDRWEDDE